MLAFGLVKGVLNFVAGRLSERIGRKKVLVLGWVVALPIPVIVWLAPSWNWIVFATVLLGFNQGLCWSILIPQAPAVIAAFTAQGFALDRHDRVTGWSTLTLTRR